MLVITILSLFPLFLSYPIRISPILPLALTASCVGAFCPTTRPSLPSRQTTSLGYVVDDDDIPESFKWQEKTEGVIPEYSYNDDFQIRLAKWYWRNQNYLNLPVVIDGVDKIMLVSDIVLTR